MNSTPIPISSALITVTGINAAVGNGVITVKPSASVGITITPGPYSLGTSTITFKITYTDAGGYTWNETETETSR